MTLLAVISLLSVISQTAQLKIDSLITSAMDNGVFSGAVVEVVREKGEPFLKAWGHRCVVPEEEAMDVSTIFDVASISKCVSTTIVALKLCEQGLINPDAYVKEYIQDFAPYVQRPPRKGSARYVRNFIPETADITVRQLLYHTSGLPAGRLSYKLRETHGPDYSDLEDYLFHDATRINKPGTKYRYSCLGFLVLQSIIERVSGKDLCDLADSLIFKPLGMKDTYYFRDTAPDELIGRIAPTETELDSLGEWHCLRGTVHDPLAREFCHGNAGNAGVFTTASDLAKISLAILGKGQYKGVRILKSESVRMMTRPDKFSGRTAGWDSNEREKMEWTGELWEKGRVICHTGFTGPSIMIDTKSDTVVILMCSRLHPQPLKPQKGQMTLMDVRRALSDIVASDL